VNQAVGQGIRPRARRMSPVPDAAPATHFGGRVDSNQRAASR
jgi:hypothetical protein